MKKAAPARGRPRDAAVDERIVEATRALLDEGGISAVSLAAVAARAEVGRPTLYRRHPNRDALVRAVLARDVAALTAAVQVPDGPLVERLFAHFEPFIDYYAAHPERARALLRASLINQEGPDGALNRLNLARHAAVARLLADAHRTGELDAQVDPTVAASVLFSATLGGVLGFLNGVVPDAATQKRNLRAVFHQHLRC